MNIIKHFLVALLLLPMLAFAAYPERPITLIVAYPPGGGTDLVARALAPYVEKYLGGGAKIVVVAINIGEALQYQKGGTPLRNLVQMSPARTNLAPELRTAREQGYDIEMSSLRGMAAPKGLPADIRERLVAAVERAAADAEFQAQAVRFFAPLRYLTPVQYEAIVRDADRMYRAMWRDMPWADN